MIKPFMICPRPCRRSLVEQECKAEFAKHEASILIIGLCVFICKTHFIFILFIYFFTREAVRRLRVSKRCFFFPHSFKREPVTWEYSQASCAKGEEGEKDQALGWMCKGQMVQGDRNVGLGL